MARARDLLPLKPEIFHILLSLAEDDRHGYAIMKDVEESTGGAVSLRPSPLYRRLRHLLEMGVIAEADGRPDPRDDDQRRRYYRLTEVGRGILATEARRVTALASDRRIKRLADLRPGGEHA